MKSRNPGFASFLHSWDGHMAKPSKPQTPCPEETALSCFQSLYFRYYSSIVGSKKNKTTKKNIQGVLACPSRTVTQIISIPHTSGLKQWCGSKRGCAASSSREQKKRHSEEARARTFTVCKPCLITVTGVGKDHSSRNTSLKVKPTAQILQQKEERVSRTAKAEGMQVLWGCWLLGPQSLT